MKSLFYLLLCSISLLTIGCYNKGKKVALDTGITNHLYFKEGSYWVFKDSVSGQLDSVYVLHITDEYEGPREAHFDQTAYQTVDIKLAEYCNGIYDSLGFLKYERNTIRFYIYRDSVGNRNNPGYDLSSTYPGAPAVSVMTINGVDYSNPVLYTFYKSAQGAAYFVDDIGPVKITITYPGNPQVYVWGLLRWHVVM